MQNIVKKIFVALAVLFSVATAPALISPTPTFAADGLGSCRSFLGMTSWDCGINKDMNSEDILKSNVFLIGSNILTDLAVIATYLVIGFVIYGGYQYIFSGGDAGKVANGKKTLTRAFIGLGIVILANVILNSIRIAFLGTSGSFTTNCAVNGGCVDQVSFVTNTINWFIGTAGIIAVVYVVIGGIGYVTSAGDAAKLQKSKSTILYALIGIVICALSLTATAFVSNLLNRADTPTEGYINQTIIAKESHEKHN